MDPFSSPPTTPMSVVIEEPPRKRRTGRYIVLAVVAVAAIAGIAFAVTRGDDTEKYSLTGVNSATEDMRSMSFTTTTKGFGTEVTAEIEADVENEILHIQMDLGNDVAGFGGDMEMIVDIKSETTYINGAFFEAFGLELDTTWLEMDGEWLAENGQDTVFNVDSLGDPLDAAVAIEDAVKVEEIGFDEVNGTRVKHYTVTFKSDDVFAGNEQLATQVSDLGGEMPDEVVYEFYVDEDNQLRRVTYEMDIGSGELYTDIVIVSINEPVNVEIPDEDDVTDARDFL